jgi:hypothetical protein
MVDIMADPERAWQSSMRHYFQEVDYHGLAQLFRKWYVKGTENKNGTWIDWNQVPENCQREVKTYVFKVVESRRKQKEWEDYVRRESLEMSHQQMMQQQGHQQDKQPNQLEGVPEQPVSMTGQEGSFTFEEREHITKNENWGKKSFHKRVANPTVDETNPSQWVLDRVPYPLAQQTQQGGQGEENVEQRANDGATAAAMMSRWKKVGNLSHLILRDTHLRWVDEEYDESYFEKDKKWREQEESWWKDSNGTIKKMRDDELSRLDTMERQRIQKAHQWMKNRNKFSTQNQKTLRRFRDFLRLQTSRNSILICPASWAKQSNMASQRGKTENDGDEEIDEDDVSQQQPEYPSYQDRTDEDDNDDDDAKPVNPWDRTGEDDDSSTKKRSKKKVGQKKCAINADKKGKGKEKKGATIFESGIAVQKTKRGRKKN